jgi:hypothetical protein
MPVRGCQRESRDAEGAGKGRAQHLSCTETRSIDGAAFAVDANAPEFAAFRAHYPTCAECAREVERWTRLEWSLRGSDTHPEPSALAALHERPASLTEPQRRALTEHVETCAACRSELSALRHFDFAQLRERGAIRGQPHPARRALSMRRPWRSVLALAGGIALMAASALLLRAWRFDRPEPDRPTLARGEVPARKMAPETAAPAPAPAPTTEAPPVAMPTPDAGDAPQRVARATPAPEPVLPAPPTRVAGEAPSSPPAVPPSPAPPDPPLVAIAFPEAPLVYAKAGETDRVLARLREPSVLRGEGRVTSPRIQALAPDHVGLTVEASPTLYWALSAPTDQRIEIVVTDEQAETPLLDRSLDGARAGIHAIDLGRAGVRLDPGVTYRWYATVVPDTDDRTSEVVSGGAIRRVPLDPALAKELASSPAGARAHLLASAGLFYDALDVVSGWVSSHPDAAEPRRDRRALLTAVGLASVMPEEPAAP